MSEADVSSREEYHVIPKSRGGKLAAFLLSVVPSMAVIALSAAWFRTCRQTLENTELRSSLIQHQTFQIARLIIDFNFEREMTVVYVTARTEYTQEEAREALAFARAQCDHTLSQLLVWPGVPASAPGDHQTVEDQMFRSSVLFSAILARHRSSVKHGSYFWDEVQYYTDIMDVLIGWFNRASSALLPPGAGDDDEDGGPLDGRNGRRRLWQLLASYGYLLGAVSYLGAEQALCSVFHAVVCFSHRETFYYANFSFAGEALFRLYRQSYPETRSDPDINNGRARRRRRDDWRTAPHQSFFPELYACRREILADLDHVGMTPADPSSCSDGRRNETRFAEVDQLTSAEAQDLSAAVLAALGADSGESRAESLVGAVVVTSCVCYVTLAHVVRCVVIRCVNVRIRRKRKEKLMTFHCDVATPQLSIVRHQTDVGSTNDYYSLEYKAPPVEDIFSYHRSKTTTTTGAGNPCDSLKFSLENCTCSGHNSPSNKLAALKVASV